MQFLVLKIFVLIHLYLGQQHADHPLQLPSSNRFCVDKFLREKKQSFSPKTEILGICFESQKLTYVYKTF